MSITESLFHGSSLALMKACSEYLNWTGCCIVRLTIIDNSADGISGILGVLSSGFTLILMRRFERPGIFCDACTEDDDANSPFFAHIGNKSSAAIPSRLNVFDPLPDICNFDEVRRTKAYLHVVMVFVVESVWHLSILRSVGAEELAVRHSTFATPNEYTMRPPRRVALYGRQSASSGSTAQPVRKSKE
ncbi:hypothetical protein AB5N19_01760 [Seiridium cardinale]